MPRPKPHAAPCCPPPPAGAPHRSRAARLRPALTLLGLAAVFGRGSTAYAGDGPADSPPDAPPAAAPAAPPAAPAAGATATPTPTESPTPAAIQPAPGGALSLPTFLPLVVPPAEIEVTASRAGGPGYTPPLVHITTDPLMPQKYRSVPAGKYTCSVTIQLDPTGKVTDILPVSCDQDSLWALSTAIVAWQFEPALQDGQPVASELPYTTEFEVKTLLPRKHVVGFVGLVASMGGESYGSVEGRIHLGETISLSGGVGFDQNKHYYGTYQTTNPTFHGDFAFSSPRQYFEHRGIFGATVGGYVDPGGQSGLYGAFRGELMTAAPGLSVGGDIGVGTVFATAEGDDSLGIFPRIGLQPFYPWLRVSLIWYAPVPRDQFVVVPRADDPVVYEAIIVQDAPPPVDASRAFDGVPAVHWSKIPVSGGENPSAGPEFASYPPGQYTCNVRVLVGEDGNPKQVRAEKCPAAGVAAAENTVKSWKWRARPGAGDVQAVFPAPIYVDRAEAAQVRVSRASLAAEDGSTTPIPSAKMPEVWVKKLYTPVFSNGITPAGECTVDVDLDATGAVLGTRWRSGNIEVKPRVLEALALWEFYGVPVDGELRAVHVSLPMCTYPPLTTQAEIDAAKASP